MSDTPPITATPAATGDTTAAGTTATAGAAAGDAIPPSAAAPAAPAAPAATTAGVVPPSAEIRTESLVKTYGRRNVVDGVDINIHAGEVVGLLGPNGAGKTTTFYMIVGLVPATGGRVLLDGRDATRLRMHERARRGVGYLPQEASIFRKLTVEDNILAIVETLGIPRRERAARVSHHLEELHLAHVARQRAYTLSGGERRRLEIARALVTRPKFLLMDEPFAGVDPISVADVQKMILALKQRGIGILITDHQVRETLRIVDRAYIIHKGKVLTAGTSAYLINDPQAREFYLGEDFNL
jgi:lipopolysaccharide export system ATP-binding protein